MRAGRGSFWRRAGAVEVTDLEAADRALLIEEAALAAGFLKAQTHADKINLGALGNVVGSSTCMWWLG
jgi:diadenosine tetraphosphate (Ap4A) HIT family hydrolase